MLSTVKEFNHVELLHNAIPYDCEQWPVHDLGCLEIPAKILAFPNQLLGHSFSLIEKKQWYNGAAFIKSKIRMIWDVWRYRPRYWISDQCSQLLVRTCSSIENKQWSKQSLIPAKILVFESSIVDSDQKVKSFSAFHFAHATGT